MAGLGSRFAEAGYADPKPLIPVFGVPMIEVVINNLRPRRAHRFVFLCQRSHEREYGLRARLKRLEPSSEVILLDGLTAGAACTVLLAKQLINNRQPLMIANCDQWVNYSIDDYLTALEAQHYHGGLMTMHATSPKWSYVQRDSAGKVNAVVEKQVVSDEATVGIYNYAAGRDFVQAAEAMIAANLRVNNEFYVAPAYTQLVQRGRTIVTHCIGSDVEGMYGLGTPADLERFLKLDFAARIQHQRRTAQAA